MDINKDIKNILDEQIKKQTTIPTTDDIVKDSALFEIEDGKVSFTSHPSTMEHQGLRLRCEAFSNMCGEFGINNIKFLFFPHDNTSCYENNEHYTICFSKIKHQNFITAPNIHLLGGMLDAELNAIKQHDISFEEKEKSSIFVGGPQGKKRGDYVYSLSGNSKHIGLLTNRPIISIPYQLRYLFQINIDGHTMCYDRLYWQMASNSIPVYLDRDKEIIQLHDELIIPNRHYVESTAKTWLTTYEELVNESSMKVIADNGKEFVERHFGNDPMYNSMLILEYILKAIKDQQNV